MSSELPQGILPFLFTDIEGSTPLWEQDPEGMQAALATHNVVLQQAIETHGGQVFKIVGDEFQVVFMQPLDAVRAAIAAQRALADKEWGQIGPLRVRMGIHTGHAIWEGGDYAVSHTFNRAARLMSAGHGGQILVSQETAALLRDQLPQGAHLQNMGRHRLKGMSQEEQIFQLVAPGLPSDFPPLKTLAGARHNLPAPLTPFIGREEEIEELAALLSPGGDRHVRLLTLSGPGGMGKTRLALEVARRLLSQFADGIFFVDLSPIGDPDSVLPAIKRALSLRESPGQSSDEVLVEYLRDKQLLLILDNFEQLLPAAVKVAELLPVLPGLKLLITSRSLLRIYGEVDYQVGSLPYPDPKHLPPPQELLQIASVKLFLEHARAVKTGFSVDVGNARSVAEICRRLDGLPLAIELAAARVRLLQPGQILLQLENRYRLLSGGARNLPPRQRTLEGAIGWSYDLLEPQEQALFRRLGIFANGCTFAAAEAVCDPDGEMDIFVGLEALIDHSLIGQGDGSEGARFQMLNTVRDFALYRLERSGEKLASARRHFAFYARLAGEAQPYLESAEQNIWLDRLEEDSDNLHVALQFAISEGDVAQALPLARALRIFWFLRGYLLEGRRHLQDLLALSMMPEQRAQLLDDAGFLARYQGDYAAAEATIQEGLSIARRLENRHTIADFLANAGFVYLQQGQFDRARELYGEALSTYDELANEQGTADASIHLGLAAFYEGDYAGAEAYYHSSLSIWQRLGDPQGIVYAQQMLGDAAYQSGEYEAAAQWYVASLRGASAIGFQLVMASALEGAALIAAIRQEPGRALQLAGAAASLRKEAAVPASAARQQFLAAGLPPAVDQRVSFDDETFVPPLTLDEAMEIALGI